MPLVLMRSAAAYPVSAKDLQPNKTGPKTVKELHARMAYLFPLVSGPAYVRDPSFQKTGFFAQTITAMTSMLSQGQQQR